MPKQKNNDDEDQSSKSIDQKILELDQKIEWFYSDDFSLDQALIQYHEACSLADKIEKELAEMKNKIEVLADFSDQ